MCMYEVEAKCGHVGKKYYVVKTFAVVAETAKEAAAIVRQKARVKHHHRDAIRNVYEIDEDRYWEIIMMNKNDPYFNCHNIQEQRKYCDLILCEECPEENSCKIKKEGISKKTWYDHKKQLRNPKKYLTRYAA